MQDSLYCSRVTPVMSPCSRYYRLYLLNYRLHTQVYVHCGRFHWVLSSLQQNGARRNVQQAAFPSPHPKSLLPRLHASCLLATHTLHHKPNLEPIEAGGVRAPDVCWPAVDGCTAAVHRPRTHRHAETAVHQEHCATNSFDTYRLSCALHSVSIVAASRPPVMVVLDTMTAVCAPKFVRSVARRDGDDRTVSELLRFQESLERFGLLWTPLDSLDKYQAHELVRNLHVSRQPEYVDLSSFLFVLTIHRDAHGVRH